MSEPSEEKRKDHIIKTVGHNTLYGYAVMVWSTFLGFWITPYILRALGNELYGIWGIALSTFSAATFFDLGLGSALVFFVADKRIRESSDEVNATINSGLFLNFCFGFLGGLLLVGGGHVIVHNFLKVSPKLQELATATLSIYGLLFMVQMPAKIYEDVLIGMQRLDITNKTGLCIRTVERLLVLFLVLKGIHFLVIVWISGSLAVSLYFIEFFFVKQLMPNYHLRLTLRKKDLKALFSTGGQQFIAGVGYVFMGVIDRFLLGSLLHVRMVTFYDLASRPSQLLHQLSLRFFQPVYPAATELKARQKNEQLKSLFKKGTKIVFVLFAPLAFSIFFWSLELVRLWVGTGYDLAGQMLRILTVNYFVLSLNVIPSAMMFGLNKAWILSWESLTRIFLNFVLSFIFINRIGPLGAAYGVTLASLMTTMPFFWWMAREVGIGGKELFFEVLLFPLLILSLGPLFFMGGPLLGFHIFWRFATFTIFFLCTSLFFYIGKGETISLLKAVFVRSER